MLPEGSPAALQAYEAWDTMLNTDWPSPLLCALYHWHLPRSELGCAYKDLSENISKEKELNISLQLNIQSSCGSKARNTFPKLLGAPQDSLMLEPQYLKRLQLASVLYKLKAPVMPFCCLKLLKQTFLHNDMLEKDMLTERMSKKMGRPSCPELGLTWKALQAGLLSTLSVLKS